MHLALGGELEHRRLLRLLLATTKLGERALNSPAPRLYGEGALDRLGALRSRSRRVVGKFQCPGIDMVEML